MVRTEATPVTWRVEEPVRRLGVGVALLFVLLATFLTVIGVAPSGVILIWLIAVAVMLSIWRWYLVPYVELGPEQLVVQGPFARHTVRCASIRDVKPGVLGLRIETRRGDSFLGWAIQKSKVADWMRKETRADEVAAAIMERASLARA